MNPTFFTPLPPEQRCAARALVVALALGLASIAFAVEPAKRSFNVPAADAEKALKVFSEQARLEVLFPTALVSGVRTKSVSGDLPPREALTQMLAGTGLVAVQDEKTGALSLRSGAKEPTSKNVEADPSRAARPIGPADVAKSTSTSDGVIELSPFVVGSSTDRGYQALNTLSGTRLNSKLEDLGSSITVVTKQQMDDTAVLDLNDVFLYEANTEGTGNFTDFSTNRNGGVVDNIQNSPAQANRIRGVGRANIAVGGFAVNPRIPLDPYNVDGVEISRGPNSNIFGLGGSAGTVNYIPIRANATRSISQVTFRADSYGGVRGTFDFNRPLLTQKLALRVAAVEEAKGFVRKPSSEKISRLQGLVLFKPFANTTLRASAENYDNFARRTNSLTPRETVTGWAAAGKPTWDPTTQTVTLANGTKSGPFRVNQDGTLPFGLISQGGGFYSRNSVFIDYASPEQLMSVNRTGTLPANRIPTPTISNTDLRFLEGSSRLEREFGALFPLYILPTTTDKALYDWSKVNYMSPNTYTDRAKTFTVEAEQIVVKTPQHLLAARAAWFGQDFKSTRRNKVDNTESTLRVDVNEKMLDGSPNPYFLRPYFGSSAPVSTFQPEQRDIQSADLAYQWTPAKLPRGLGWIGQQKLGLHGETSRIDFASFRRRDLIQSDHPWSVKTNRSATGVWVYDKFYVGDNQGQNIDHAPATRPTDGQHTLRWFNALTNQWVSESVDVGENFFNAGVFTNSRTEVRTLNATVQNYFFQDRLVTTFGWRNDRQRVRESLPPAIDPATGWFQNEPLKTKLPWILNEGKTLTQGAVLKPTRWLNMFYNQSDSFTPAGVVYDALGELLPNPKGKGKDYGVGISLLNDRLHLKINRYETNDQGARGGDLDTVVARAWTLDGRGSNGIADTATDFQTFAQVTVAQRFAKQGVTPTAAQSSAAVAQYMGLTQEFLAGIQSFDRGTTADVTSRGYEFEAIYNPTRTWRLKFTAAQQVAIDSNIGDGLQRYLTARLPIWTTAKDENGVAWWTRSIGGGATPKQTYEGTILAPIKLATANNGKPRSQVREWRWNVVTNYDFTEGRLKHFSVGGALRWQDQGGIGFLAAAPDPDGVVRELDANKPVYDKARLAVDLSASYRLRLFGDRVRAKFQLNVRNVQENGSLQAVGVNPDGRPFAYRIVDPRQFILSTTFDL
jgi:outer membrane receptor protein involved in Fe transport